MKGLHFARFYLLFFLAACVFIFSFNKIYINFFAPPANYTILVDQVFAGVEENNVAQYRLVNKDDIILDTKLLTLLDDGKIVSYREGSNLYYLKQFNDLKLIQWGPILQTIDSDSDTLLVVFYMALATLFLVLMRPLFRDIHKLQNSAIEFGKKPASQPLTIKPNSSVYPLAKSLHTMSHDLLEHIQQQKDLANIVAHEVRTPLARMKFVLQSLEHKIPDKQRLRINADIKELETVAHEYLEFGRSQNTDNDYLRPTKLQTLIDSLEDKFVNLEIDLRFSNNNSKQVVLCNEPQLLLAITNLINNALRYARTSIDVSFVSMQEQLDISVIDDGPGFKHINQAQDNLKGFGLGLYIVKKIAQRHAGELTIDTTTDKKTRVKITLPL